MNLGHVITLTLVFWALGALDVWFAMPMIDQPLVIGALTGLILGDLTSGVRMGAHLQLVFLGVMGIGGTLPPDANTGTLIGTAFAISLKQDIEVALTFAIPVAMLGSFIFFAATLARSFINPIVIKFIEEGRPKAIEAMHYGVWIIGGLPKAIMIFSVLLYGSTVAQSIIDNIPAAVNDGFQVAAGLMPAAGFALLLRIMWTAKLGVYFFLGFILVSFFHLDIIAVASIGIVIAVILFVEGQGKRGAHASSGEGDLFND